MDSVLKVNAMTNPKTKISDKYGVWPETTTNGLKAIKELNSIIKAILRAKAVKCLK